MRYLGLFLLIVCVLLAQNPSIKDETDVKLPNGKSQKDEIIRVDYERNLRDAGELARLSEEVKDDLEKGDRYLVSCPGDFVRADATGGIGVGPAKGLG